MAQKTGAPIRQSLAKQMPTCDWPSLSASWVSLTPFLCLFLGPPDALMFPSSGFSSHTQMIQRMGWILRYPLELLSGYIDSLQGEGFCLLPASRPVPAVSYYYYYVPSVVSDSVQPHRQQPTRLRHPWGSPGKNTGVGCHFLLQCMKVKSESEVTQS